MRIRWLYLTHESMRIIIRLFNESHHTVMVDVEALSRISNESRIS